MDKFDSIKVGDIAELTHLITQADLDQFVDLTGDNNKLHVSSDYAQTTSFKKPVVHGMLGASFISTIIGTKLPGDGALWISQNIEFLLPVRIGDTLTIKAEVTKKIDKERLLEIHTQIFNQHRQRVTNGSGKVKVLPTEPPLLVQTNTLFKTALITGATGGIGQAICRQLADQGYDIVAHYHSNKNGAFALKESIEKKGSTCHLINADLSDCKQINNLVTDAKRMLGSIGVFVHCASPKIPLIKLLDLDWSDFENQLNVSVKACFSLLKLLIPIMEKQKYGRIINLTSQAIETPSAGWLHYITSKSAISGFSRALAIELAAKGITVNMVSPGMTDTDLVADLPEKARLLVSAKAPLKRLATPDDVASAVCFLASEHASYITGETIRINGGQVML